MEEKSVIVSLFSSFTLCSVCSCLEVKLKCFLVFFCIICCHLMNYHIKVRSQSAADCQIVGLKTWFFFFIHFFPFEGCTSLKLKDPECCGRKKNWKFSLDFSPILIKMLYQSQLLEDFYFVSLWSECSWRATQCTELFSLTSLLKICLISDQLWYIYISKRSIFLFNILGWFL